MYHAAIKGKKKRQENKKTYKYYPRGNEYRKIIKHKYYLSGTDTEVYGVTGIHALTEKNEKITQVQKYHINFVEKSVIARREGKGT